MNTSYLQKALLGRITAGDVDEVVGEPNMFTAGIDIFTASGATSSSDMWLSQIEVHGATEKDAVALRDFILGAVQAKLEVMSMHDWRKLP